MALQKTCRIPGYRNYSLTTHKFAPVKVCKTPLDYHLSAAWSRENSEEETTSTSRAVATCTRLCSSQPCTQITYTTRMVLSAFDIYDRQLTNFTNVWEDAGMKKTILKLTLSKGQTRMVTLTNAYGIWQLVGEVGGTWGLFLGLSAITVLDGFEKMFVWGLTKIRMRNAPVITQRKLCC
jgi:hypothetical protein